MDFIPRTTRRNLLQTLDGPCSALALNCCQFSCCIPHDALSRYYDDDDETDDTSFQHADWMQQVLTACPTLKLRDLVLPGTHDSGSYSIPWTSPFSAAGRTQNLSVLQQLQRGARYVDLRVGGSKSGDNASSIWHGCLIGDAFQRVMDQVATFLQQHAGEFVIVEVVAEYGRPFTPTQKIQCLSVVHETLGDKVYQNPNNNANDLTALFQQSNLVDVIQQQKKQCLILLHGRFYEGLEDTPISGITYNEDYIASHYGFFRSDHWMNNRWYNTRDISKLLQWNLEEVQQQNGGSTNNNRNQLLQNQFILTPGVGGPTDILALLVGRLSLRPVSFALRLYQGNLLEDYVRQHAKEPWNMIMLDFIDLVPGLVAFLISLNYNNNTTNSNSKAAPKSNTASPTGHKLQIQLAAAHDGKEGSTSSNVTDKIQTFLPRDAVLYVTDAAKDLGLSFSTGTLTLVYRFNGGNNRNNNNKWQVKQVKFDADTQVLLSMYAANPGSTVAIMDDSGGVVFQGQRHTSGDKTPTNCTVVQYKIHGTDQEPEITLVN